MLLKLVNAEGKAGESVIAQGNALITVHMGRLSESSFTKMSEGGKNNNLATRTTEWLYAMELLKVSLLLLTDEHMKNLGCLFGNLHNDPEQFVDCTRHTLGHDRWTLRSAVVPIVCDIKEVDRAVVRAGADVDLMYSQLVLPQQLRHVCTPKRED